MKIITRKKYEFHVIIKAMPTHQQHDQRENNIFMVTKVYETFNYGLAAAFVTSFIDITIVLTPFFIFKQNF